MRYCERYHKYVILCQKALRLADATHQRKMTSSLPPARALMNEEINFALSILPEISSMFRNPNADLTSLRITTESDFIMGAVWATCLDYFNIDFRLRHVRHPTSEEIQEGNLVVFERGAEIRQAIDDRVGL
jgi:hypothetical protein